MTDGSREPHHGTQLVTDAPEAATAQVATPPEPSAQRPRHAPWTLQRKLIVTVVSITSFILVLVGVATSAILGAVVEDGLTSELREQTQSTASHARTYLIAGMSAEDILAKQPMRPGTLLVVQTLPAAATAAYVGEDGSIVALTDEQLAQLVATVPREGPLIVTIDEVGTFRVDGEWIGESFIVVGLSRDKVANTIAQMLTAIGLLTAGGLVLLATATAWTIRAGLAPLRAVADTAARVSTQRLDQGEVSIAERVPAAQADPRTEVGRVGEALNSLLDHVDESLTVRQRNEERMRAFVADASHELRTPLASIRGYSELSLRALGRDHAPATIENTQTSLERIQAQSLRMTSLVEDLLLLARLDEGQELVFGTVDLTRLVIDAVGDARPTGPRHRWVLDVGDEPVLVAGDAGRLHQVAANLLANARTHTPEGTTVTVSVAREGAKAVLRVHDDGPGIDPAITDELFERFSRADRSRARQTGGTGLGLSIARAIVDAHRGTLTVTSSPGDTLFEVRLPARPSDPAA
ncbi:HAMP domain-containing histidine kinase [Microbacterium sp. HD4P20]|uniref:sensor histidine kinase n=1 Tax=Microbacterium sp. HD4P20 TaxID=2864874 RepID=UPI001C63EC46|nr:ATP-binding protein [Microbacterium sp. HD4P20]MCP2637789.1 HAMP domain-containing histidine kinase [Microbacterium sp. HD4P20]